MGNAAMCDCVPCRIRKPNGPPAKDNGATGEHLCTSCLRNSQCLSHPGNNPKEDLPEDDVVQYAKVK